MSDSVEPRALLAQTRDLACEAGARILEIYDTDFDVESKEDNSPLTAADMASHTAIVNGLRALTPEIPVLSEESADVPYDERRQWDWYWLIDPLDGTKEFIKRNGEFTVNIALIHAGRPVLGVVYVPVKQWLYAACEGEGATKQVGDGPAEPIHVRRLPDGPVAVVGSRSHRGDSLEAFLQKLGEHEIVSMGSSLKLCLVAEGEADIYPRLGPTSEWDTAAAQCVVEQAGGKVTDLEMKELRYNQKESVLNPFFLVIADDSRDWSQYLE
ncbi:3'(2'),5'-bisphosphate nucleotidase CysQ [Thiohalobacter thiocyanaticus]|uniref:3'(2'),5'-bisphosphate nucleotidase CysQ n=1 Tax=Thiohalobacter thiocyanaticus TaxID=585455 RepID=A0A426QI85_9GAMM|nr:3'(2'),5'-bisphosphate nucleotidase CysQ [Thiohalobacter thiocyanaticus]RRQ21457.1 3'(2'),5'-bisphosphate nucleotidase [Thiohalobacter thiocyanaticus]